MRTQILLPGGKDFDGTDYIYVYGDGTPNENGVELANAVDKAYNDFNASVGTYGNQNKVQKVVIGPGKYNFTSTKQQLNIDPRAVELHSLTGNQDVYLTRNNNGIERQFRVFDLTQTNEPTSLNNDYQTALDQIQFDYPSISYFSISQYDISFSDGSFIAIADYYIGPNTLLFRIFPDGTYNSLMVSGCYSVQGIKVVNDQIFAHFWNTPWGGQKLIKIDQNLNIDFSFNMISINSTIMKMIQPVVGGDIYLVGQFTLVDGFSRARYAKINSSGILDLTFNTSLGADNTVMSVAYNPVENYLMIGGWFNQINGSSRKNFAYIDPTTGTDITSIITASLTINNAVIRIEYDPYGNNTLLFGQFWTVNGNYTNSRTAVLDSAGTFVGELFASVYFGTDWYSMYCNPSESTLIKKQNTGGGPYTFPGPIIIDNGDFIQWDFTSNSLYDYRSYVFNSNLSNVNTFGFKIISGKYAITESYYISTALIPMVFINGNGFNNNRFDDSYTISGIYIYQDHGCFAVGENCNVAIKNCQFNIYGSRELDPYSVNATYAQVTLKNCKIPIYGVCAGRLNIFDSYMSGQDFNRTIAAAGYGSSMDIYAYDSEIYNFYSDPYSNFSNVRLNIELNNCFINFSFRFFTVNNQYGFHSMIYNVKATDCQIYSSFIETYCPRILLFNCELQDVFRIGGVDVYDELFTWYSVEWEVKNCKFGYNCFTIDSQGGDMTQIINRYGSYGPGLYKIKFSDITCRDNEYSSIPEFKLFLGSYNGNARVDFNNITGAYGGSARQCPLSIDVEWGRADMTFALDNISYKNCLIDANQGYGDYIFSVTQRYRQYGTMNPIGFNKVSFINCHVLNSLSNYTINNAFYLGVPLYISDPLQVSFTNVSFVDCKATALASFISTATNYSTTYGGVQFINCTADSNDSFISNMRDLQGTLINETFEFNNCNAKHKGFLNNYDTLNFTDYSGIVFKDCTAAQGFVTFKNFSYSYIYMKAINCRVIDGNSFGKGIKNLYCEFRYCHGGMSSFGSMYSDSGSDLTTVQGSVMYCTGVMLFGTDVGFPLQGTSGIAEFNSTGGSAAQVIWAISSYNS